MRFRRTSALALAVAGSALITPGAVLAAGGGGIDTGTAAPTGATASPLTLNGVLVLNRSETTEAGSQVTVLQVAGLNLLSKNGAGINTGTLAIAGTVLDAVNHALCSKGSEPSGFCVALLFSNTTEKSAGGTFANNGSSGVAAVTLGSFHLRLLGSEASTTNAGGACTSTSLSYILNTTDTVKLPGGLLGALEHPSVAGPGAC